MHAALVPVCEANLEAVADIGAELMALSSYKAAFDRRWAIGIARTAMNLPNYFGRLAQLHDGTYCGIIVGSVMPMLFSPQLMGVEETIYVRDKTPFRTSIAKSLLVSFTQWAFVEKKVSFIRAGETSEICPKAVGAFFKLQGFKLAGTVYKKDAV